MRLVSPPATVPLGEIPRQEGGRVPVSRLALALSVCSCDSLLHCAGSVPVSVLLLRFTLRSFGLSDQDAGIEPVRTHICHH